MKYRFVILQGVFLSVLLCLSGGVDAQGESPLYEARDTIPEQEKKAPYQYDPRWKGKLEHPEYYENKPQALEKYKGKFQYGFDYGPGEKDNGLHPSYPMEDERTPYWKKGTEGKYIPARLKVSILRDPENMQKGFIIYLASEEMLETCADPGEIKYKTEVNNKIYLDIYLQGFDIRAPQSSSRYCDMKSYRPAAKIPLTRGDLEGIKQIRFRTLYKIDYFNVDLQDEYLALRPARVKDPVVEPSEDPRYDDPLGHWFYPENTVLLYYAGSAGEDNKNTESSIKKIASSWGLTPIDRIVKSFRPGIRDGKVYYFTDPEGRLSEKIKDGEKLMVGKITTYRNIRQMNGTRRMPVYKKVYAKVPGHYE